MMARSETVEHKEYDRGEYLEVARDLAEATRHGRGEQNGYWLSWGLAWTDYLETTFGACIGVQGAEILIQ